MHDRHSKIDQVAWHSIAKEEALQLLDSSSHGLSSIEAENRFKLFGYNVLPQASRSGAIKRFLRQFNNVLIYVLLCAALITILLQHWFDAGVILAVVCANAVIGFIQEGKSEKSIDAIRHLLAYQALVMRDNKRTRIPSEMLVPGDLVFLVAGDKVPADLRLLTVNGLSIQEATLTGESLPVEKNIKAIPANAVLGDRACMAFSGTLVTSGQGSGLVVGVGSNTELGHISGLLESIDTITTPLVTQMNIFAKWLSTFILIIATLLLAYGYVYSDYNFSELFMIVVALSVAAIPEGLPTVLTVTLAIGVQIMARRNAVVRHLPAVETLGEVSVICTDKTGTLTRNEMMVASVISNTNMYTIDGAGYNPAGVIKLDGIELAVNERQIFHELARTAILCNDADLSESEGVWACEGDPMEGALLTFANKTGANILNERVRWVKTDSIPFDSKYNYMATLNHNDIDQACVFLKGAPEYVLKLCDRQRNENGDIVDLDLNYWIERVEEVAARGQRVLAFAELPAAPAHAALKHTDLKDSMILLGLVGLIDPPRQEAIAAIQECYSAGIRVIMITGDHAKTAAAIGELIGLDNASIVLTGADLESMDHSAFKAAVMNCNIFARTSPANKLQLVMALQSHGMIVAMTGDGVNDAPAVKRANAGIAMGRKGSEAVKEAADLVLLDDNFASITAAVREGRTVFNNLSKVIAFMLPVNGGESISLIVALLLGLTLPISPIQLLWINMIGSVVLAMTLAFEKSEPEIMQIPPRNPATPLLSNYIIWRVLFVSLLFAAGIFTQFHLAIYRGYDISTARTIAVNTLIAMEVFYLFSIRYGYGTSLTWRGFLGTKQVLLALVIICIVQLLFIYAPFMQYIFDTQPLQSLDLVLVSLTGMLIFFVVEIEKWICSLFKTRT